MTLKLSYIYGAVKGHRDAMFTAAVQSLDGAKPNTNPKTNPNPNTNLTVILILTLTQTLLPNASRKIITLLTELQLQTAFKSWQILSNSRRPGDGGRYIEGL